MSLTEIHTRHDGRVFVRRPGCHFAKAHFKRGQLDLSIVCCKMARGRLTGSLCSRGTMAKTLLEIKITEGCEQKEFTSRELAY